MRADRRGPNRLPTVSKPLEGKEVNADLTPEDFTIETGAKSLAKKKDLFKDLMNEKIALENTNRLKLTVFE